MHTMWKQNRGRGQLFHLFVTRALTQGVGNQKLIDARGGRGYQWLN